MSPNQNAVGEFADLRRRTIRSTPNPLDKTTIVSVYPFDIVDIKHTLQPSKFTINKGTEKEPGITVIGTASWWLDRDPEQPLLEMPVSSIILANSIITDFCNGLFGCNMSDRMPGLFFVPGKHDLVDIKKNNFVELLTATQNQNRWYHELVKQADIDWARTNGNPLAISDNSRMAAEQLGLKEKAWMANVLMQEMINCKFCGSMIRPGFPVCSICHHVIDNDAYEKMHPNKVA